MNGQLTLPKNLVEKSRAVSLDLWDTLIVGGNPELRAKRAESIRSLLNFDLPLQAVMWAIKDVDNELDAQTLQNGRHYSIGERMKAISIRLAGQDSTGNLNVAEAESTLGNLILEYPPRLKEQDIQHTLETLKDRDKTLGIISNTGFYSGYYLKKALGLLGLDNYMSSMVFSDEVALSKPDPKIFSIFAQGLMIDPSNIVHIGDNYYADYEGALDAGYQAILLSETNTTVVSAPTIKSVL